MSLFIHLNPTLNVCMIFQQDIHNSKKRFPNGIKINKLNFQNQLLYPPDMDKSKTKSLDLIHRY